jgi:hypothetical protein
MGPSRGRPTSGASRSAARGKLGVIAFDPEAGHSVSLLTPTWLPPGEHKMCADGCGDVQLLT